MTELHVFCETCDAELIGNTATCEACAERAAHLDAILANAIEHARRGHRMSAAALDQLGIQWRDA
jgi:hypothetical protein